MRAVPALPIVAALLASSAALSPLSAQQSVRFQFGWTPGMEADITTLTTTATPPGAATDAISVRATSHVSVRADARGLVIDSKASMLDLGAATQQRMATAGFPADAMTALSGSSILVSRDGRFIGLADTAAARANMERLTAPATEKMSEAPPGLRQAMAEMTSVASLTNMARIGWEQSTGSLAGVTLTQGQPTTAPQQMPFPMAQNATLDAVMTTEFVGMAPCDSTSTAATCAQVKRTTVVSAEAMKTAMLGMMKRMLGDQFDESVMNASAMPTTSLRVEAVTLLEPSTMRIHRVTAQTVSVMNMMGQERRNESTVTSTYRYTTR